METLGSIWMYKQIWAHSHGEKGHTFAQAKAEMQLHGSLSFPCIVATSLSLILIYVPRRDTSLPLQKSALDFRCLKTFILFVSFARCNAILFLDYGHSTFGQLSDLAR